MLGSFKLGRVYQFLLISLAFLFPLTVSGGTIVSIAILIIWLVSGDYRSKLDQVLSNKVSRACLVFFALHIIGLLWTEELEWGLHITKKMWYLTLLLPILLTITRKEYRQKYIAAFLLAMTISELCSYLIWFELISPFKKATVGNPTPFVDHISYNPFLTNVIDSSLISLNSSFRNILYFNRSHPVFGLDLKFIQVKGKSLISFLITNSP